MQTTLLGIAITVILALLAALVGPVFVDWERYRPQFEQEASRLIGLPVRVSGAVDVRLLPTPSLLLSGIEIGQPGRPNGLKARALGVEFALGPLLRGQFRAAQTRLVGPQFTLSLDRDGRVEFPKAMTNLPLDAVSIEHLRVDDARIVLADAASGRRITLDKVWFGGEARSLAGVFKGEGAFVLDRDLYGYRVVTSKPDDSGLKIKLGIDPADKPLTMEGEGVVSLQNGAPRFDGTVTVARGLGAVLAGGQAVLNESWKLSGRVKASPQAAAIDQIEAQYGPDERALKLNGNADLTLGAEPRLTGALSARQLDIDRFMASPDGPRQRPTAVLAQLGEKAGAALALPLPAQIEISADNVMLGGNSVQTLRADVASDGNGWSLDNVEFRAPGSTQVRLGGKLAVSAGADYAGPVDISVGDPRVFFAWFDGRSDFAAMPVKPLRLRGDVTIGPDRLAIDNLNAEIDRRGFDGRLAYVFASNERKSRLDAELRASDFDADAVLGVLNGLSAVARIDRPQELSLAVDLGQATIAGVTATTVSGKLQLGDKGLKVDRLTIGDLGGTTLTASGEVGVGEDKPRGTLALDLDARDWSGINALVAAYAPQAVDDVRKFTARIGAATLHGALDVDNESGAGTDARLAVSGDAGPLRISLRARGQGDATAFMSSRIRVDATLDSDNNVALTRFLGLDGIMPAQTGAGQFKLLLDGPADGEMTVDARLAAGDLHAESHGTARGIFAQDIKASAGLMVTKGDAQRGLPLPFTLQSRIALANGVATITDIAASLSNTRLRGNLNLKLGRPFGIDGKLETDALDVPAALGAAMGMPAPRGDGAWSSEPFAKVDWPDAIGRIELRGVRALVAPGLSAEKAGATLRFSPSEIALDDISAVLARGQLSGAVVLRKRADGIGLQQRLSLKGADAASLLAAKGEGTPVSGGASLQIDVEGSGATPKSLVGSLSGSGTVSLDKAEFAKLDPRAFVAAMRAADRGAALDPVKLKDVVGPALDSGRLRVSNAEGVVALAGGQARLGTIIAHADGADVSIAGNFNLVERALDARLVLTATTATTSAGRPELTVTLKGPVFSPQRNLDLSSLAGWLALRSVEEQAKKLEAIEAERAASPPKPPAPKPQVIAPPPRTPSTEAVAAPREQAQPLPPPIDIKPAPRPSAAKPLPPANMPTARDQWTGSQR